ncbi:hypothetical protein [Streptomyces mirabilis]|uniref:hypothetical protein n=1 Tax=Streptomyces mirabilis TaxID=68239 RepID=UPI0036878013
MPSHRTWSALIADGIENPLSAIQEFGEFQAGLKDWPAAPPSAERFEVRARTPPEAARVRVR